MEKIVKREAIAPRFKDDMIASFSKINQGKGERRTYEQRGYPQAVYEIYLSMKEGIGFAKLVNKGSKLMRMQVTFGRTGTKAIKPVTDSYCFQSKAGSEDVVGFMVDYASHQVYNKT